jgi:ketosteroid isomerase-like protein
MRYGWISVSGAGNVAWAAVDAVFHMAADGQEMSMPARITAVFEKRGEDWLIAQSHFSFPAMNQEPGQSTPS